MSSVVAQSVLQYLQHEILPNEDEARLLITERSDLKSLVANIDDAISNVKYSIEDLCTRNSKELDNYTRQTKSLYDGIEESERQACMLREVSKEHENADEKIYELIDNYDSLASKHAQNSIYIEALNQIWMIKASIMELRSRIELNMFVHSVPLLTNAEDKIVKFPGWERIALLSGLKEEVNSLNSIVFGKLDSLWEHLIQFSDNKLEISITEENVSLEDLAEALKRFDFVGKMKHLAYKIKENFLVKLLSVDQKFEIDTSNTGDRKYSLAIMASSEIVTIDKTLVNLQSFVAFINESMPKSMSHNIAVELSSIMTTTLIEKNFQSLIPIGVADFSQFEPVLKEVATFGDFLMKAGWAHSNDLQDWVIRIPNVWYKKRCDAILVMTRQIVSNAETSERKIVEKVGAIVSYEAVKEAKHRRENEDSLPSKTFAEDIENDAFDDGWNQEWGDDDVAEEESEEAFKKLNKEAGTTSKRNMQFEDEDEDAGEDGWGFDESIDLDDDDDEALEDPKTTENDNEDDSNSIPDEWNWGDDEDDSGGISNSVNNSTIVQKTSPLKTKMTLRPSKPLIQNDTQQLSNTSLQTSNLNETYVVTKVPQQILDLIQTLTDDSNLLSGKYKTSSIAPAAKNLRSLISYVLGAYRALAPMHYGDSFDSNLYLSNDCLYLSEQVSTMKDLSADAYLLMEMSRRYESSADLY
ncbi:hypothetical protein V1511DRAFT_268477 [Dipodascopsis uninucleata]